MFRRGARVVARQAFQVQHRTGFHHAIKNSFPSRKKITFAFGVLGAATLLSSSTPKFIAKEKQIPKIVEDLFDRYSSKEIDGEKYLTIEDIKSISDSISENKIKILCRLISSRNPDALSVSEFAELYEILSSPDADYRIAFLLADSNRNGFITKEEFQKVVVGENFNWTSEWVNLFFGSEGEGQLSYLEFCQLLDGLQSEKVRQEFLHLLDSKTGLVPADRFVQILRNARVPLPPGIEPSQILQLGRVSDPSDSRGEGVSFSQYLALKNLTTHLPSYGKILSDAVKTTGKEKVSQEEFLAAANRVAVHVSPMECDMVYFFFDKKKDGLLDWEELQSVIGLAEETEKNFPSASKLSAQAFQGGEQKQPKGALGYILEGVSHFGLGAIAGGIGATAVYPIDLVKTRMQNQRTLKGSTERMYKNSIDCFIKTVKSEGFIGLYRGLGPQLVGVAPEKAIKLTMNDLLRSIFKDKNTGDIYFPLEMVAGGGAGASQVIFTNPLEIVKIRLQVQGEALKKGLITAAEKQTAIMIVKELGLKGLYKGASACLLRDAPFSAIYFPFYAKMKQDFTQDGQIGATKLLLAGAIAGVPAAGLVTPADVIKTRLQVRNIEVKYKGIVDCAMTITRQEGFSALWKGAIARVFRSSPQFGVTLVSYELLQRLFGISTDKPPQTVNVPVTSTEVEKFHKAGDQMRKVEQKWFDMYKDSNEGHY